VSCFLNPQSIVSSSRAARREDVVALAVVPEHPRPLTELVALPLASFWGHV